MQEEGGILCQGWLCFQEARYSADVPCREAQGKFCFDFGKGQR